MKKTFHQLKRFKTCQSGATALEYGLIIAFLGSTLIAITMSPYSDGISNGYNKLGEDFHRVTTESTARW